MRLCLVVKSECLAGSVPAGQIGIWPAQRQFRYTVELDLGYGAAIEITNSIAAESKWSSEALTFRSTA